MQTKTLVCSVCGKHLIDTSGDQTLGNVLLKLNRHITIRHPEKYNEYVTQRDLVISLLPAYILIDWFVHREKTKRVDPMVDDALKQSQEVIGEALNNNIEVIEEDIDNKPVTKDTDSGRKLVSIPIEDEST